MIPSKTVAVPRRPDDDEIAIGTRRYVSAQRLASMYSISLKTVYPWFREADGVSKIRINKVYFELEPISEWLAERRIPTKR